MQDPLQIGEPERFFEQRRRPSRVGLVRAKLPSGQGDRSDPGRGAASAQGQTLLAVQERELVVVNTADTVEDDLMGDFVAIITSFAARLYGRRRAKRKTALVLAALQQNGTTHERHTRES